VVLTQIAPPTRENVGAYADIRQQLEALAGSINGRFGELDWVPIHYIHRAAPRRRLTAIYRSSRIALVTPLRDGMNLVAKEYVASQDAEDPGVLVLSRFAGAVEELEEALIVNPYDIYGTAEVLRTALEMSLDERRARYRALMAVIERNDLAAWCDSFLRALSRVPGDNDPTTWAQPDAIRRAMDRLTQAVRTLPPKPPDRDAKPAPTSSHSC
jgi:trehalose 6-phosphate synthase